MSVRSNWSNISCKTCIFLIDFLSGWSVHVMSGVLKSPNTIGCLWGLLSANWRVSIAINWVLPSQWMCWDQWLVKVFQLREFCCYYCYRRWLWISFSLRGNAVSIGELGGSIMALIPVELFQILEDDAVEVMHSLYLEIWKSQQWLSSKLSVFIPTSKKGNANKCSNTMLLQSPHMLTK